MPYIFVHIQELVESRNLRPPHRKFFVDKILPEFEIDIEEFNEESLDKIIESGFKKVLKESGESE